MGPMHQYNQPDAKDLLRTVAGTKGQPQRARVHRLTLAASTCAKTLLTDPLSVLAECVTGAFLFK